MPHTIVNPAELHNPIPFGYSHTASIPAGTELVLVSGQYGSDADGAVVSADFSEQVQQAFRNLGTALAAHGLDLRHVVQLRTYVVGLDVDKLRAIAAVASGDSRAAGAGGSSVTNDDDGVARTSEATGNPPTQTVIGVAGLAMPDILFEVEALAARP